VAPTPQPIVTEIRRAIVNYGSFRHEDVEKAVLSALDDLDADLTEGEYAQSSRSDAAVIRLNDAMNAADEAVPEVEDEEKEV